MWGCIAAEKRGLTMIIVPSLYVRVYRALFCPTTSRPCSLTVCEGVSKLMKILAGRSTFPHCMWGCIMPVHPILLLGFVPSLYVRVYRCSWTRSSRSCSSLTVCEGVSSYKAVWRVKNEFPHCMWGCIVFCQSDTVQTDVPSLYVRVYHKALKEMGVERRSLTVCEGVSAKSGHFAFCKMFPHCMWGCIDERSGITLTLSVPSLYVRVYRHYTGNGRRADSSLTVCEGISSGLAVYIVSSAFPHCMWWYIAVISAIGGVGCVPSLYVRVYHW